MQGAEGLGREQGISELLALQKMRLCVEGRGRRDAASLQLLPQSVNSTIPSTLQSRPRKGSRRVPKRGWARLQQDLSSPDKMHVRVSASWPRRCPLSADLSCGLKTTGKHSGERLPFLKELWLETAPKTTHLGKLSAQALFQNIHIPQLDDSFSKCKTL